MKQKPIKKWRWAIHKRIAKYFSLYTSILNFSMFMLVSHRNMVSVYDMSKEKLQDEYDCTKFDNVDQDDESGEWVYTKSFEEGRVRLISIQKRAKSERETYL